MNKYLAFALSWLLMGCSYQNWRTDDEGVILYPKNDLESGRAIRLEPYSDGVVRVMVSPADTFSTRPSLMVLPRTQKVDFNVVDEGKDLLLTTSRVKVRVDKKSGTVRFYNAGDSLLLAEKNGVSRTFQPMEVEGDKAYSVRQVFESPNDEAFYGLGQHQSDEFNWKGRNEELFQYNTKVSVPFILSNKKYGMLWDNNSLSRFGDPRPYANIDQFDLFDKNGEPGGLTATYMVNKNPDQIFTTRTETSIDYENIKSVLNFPKDFSFNNAAITWEGEIQPRESGVYRFNLYYAGYTKVYLDDSLVVAERWRTAWNPNSYKFQIGLTAGKRHKIKLEWQPDGGVSYIGLKALSPVNDQEQNRLSLWSEMARQIDYYFIVGNSADEVIGGYRTITGKSQVMPKWAMGFWQSRERYKTQDEIVNALKEFRRRQIPIDNIVLDWNYWPEDAWGSHEFDKARFPNPKQMVDDIHAMNARMMISVWPKFYVTTDHFKEFDEKGWMYQQAVKDSIRDWVGPGYVGSFYDAYSAEARQLFWKQMKEHLYTLGIDAWWMDASEPNVRDCTDMNYRKALCGPTALGTSTEYFNAYALMNAEAIYDGQRGEDNNTRVFLLTRSGFGGLQRYSTATWSGDIASRWEDMKAQVPAGINFSMSGIPYWTMDNGGFCVERRYEQAPEGSDDRAEWRELNTRWHQFGAFVPLFRTHGQYPFREMWNIAPDNHPAYRSMLYYNELRYRLMPYIYSLAGWTYFKDYTIMRGLVMDFPDDNALVNIGDQYMFGPSLMVCPVTQFKALSRQVYLPAGADWYDLYSGALHRGGTTFEAAAPYERMPVFVKAGAIVPMGPVVQHTAAQVTSPYTLMVYAGANGEFDWYNDEGTNYNYEKGKFDIIPIRYDDAQKTLVLGSREGSYDGMEETLTINVVLVSGDNACGVDKPTSKVQKITYSGSKLSVSFN